MFEVPTVIKTFEVKRPAHLGCAEEFARSFAHKLDPTLVMSKDEIRLWRDAVLVAYGDAMRRWAGDEANFLWLWRDVLDDQLYGFRNWDTK